MEMMIDRTNCTKEMHNRDKQCAFFVTQLTCGQLLHCKVDRFVYWLIQRDDITTNLFTYCTVHCTIWLV